MEKDYLQVKWCRSFPNPARGVVVGAVAGTVVAAKLTRIRDGHAAKMSAHACISSYYKKKSQYYGITKILLYSTSY
jgi:hypothetical protein